MSTPKRSTSIRQKVARSLSTKPRSGSTSSRPAHHTNDSQSAFRNPWPSADPPTWTELAKGSFPLGWYKEGLGDHEHARNVKVVKPDWGAKRKQSILSAGVDVSNCITGTWLGHAGALVEMPLVGADELSGGKPSFWALFDHVFSTRAGPTQYTGPRRMKESPCQVDDLPGCDAVLISHNHYDHLDLSTIKAISKRFPKARFCVPIGNGEWMRSTNIPSERIIELDWWQCRELGLEDLGHNPTSGRTNETLIRITSVPAQHTSGRTGMDKDTSLWCGWVIEQFLSSTDEDSASKVSRHGAVYHAGDTGYRKIASSDVVCPTFKEIGDRLGPFDLSFLPIWRGGTLGFISYLGLRLSHHDFPSAMHGSPADAADIHIDVKSRHSVPVHFGTFIGSENESYEAVIEFVDACRSRGISGPDSEKCDNGSAMILDIGESIVVDIEDTR